MSTCMYHCRLLNLPYTILPRKHISFKLEHKTIIGHASFDGSVFKMFADDKYSDIINNIIENGGGFSHAGNFDIDGDFVLSEISVTKSPRYKSEVL